MKRPRAQRTRPSVTSRHVVGDGRDREVLEYIVWAGYLTTGQVTALRFPTRRRAQRRLRALLDHGLVEAHLQGDALQRETFFSPTSKALTWLDERGSFPDGAPRRLRLPRPQKLAHALGIRDAFVAFVRAEHAGRFALDDFHFDGDLSVDPTFAPLRLIPDGLAAVRRADDVVRVGLEHDRGTETTTTLRAKFRTWASALRRETLVPLHLLVTVCGTRRTESVRRILAEVGAGERATVVEVEGVDALLDRGWPFEVATRSDRTVRPGGFLKPVGFRPVDAASPPAFGASPRVKL